jgi:hypothetical protein
MFKDNFYCLMHIFKQLENVVMRLIKPEIKFVYFSQLFLVTIYKQTTCNRTNFIALNVVKLNSKLEFNLKQNHSLESKKLDCLIKRHFHSIFVN